MAKETHKHAHKYVYTFELVNNTDTGTVRTWIEYALLTDVTGHKTRYNKEALHTALRIAYGCVPRGVRFKGEERISL